VDKKLMGEMQSKHSVLKLHNCSLKPVIIDTITY